MLGLPFLQFRANQVAVPARLIRKAHKMLADTKKVAGRRKQELQEDEYKGGGLESWAARKVRIYPAFCLPASGNRLAHARSTGCYGATVYKLVYFSIYLRSPKGSCSLPKKLKHLGDVAQEIQGT